MSKVGKKITTKINFGGSHKRTSDGNSARSRPTNKQDRRQYKRDRGQGHP